MNKEKALKQAIVGIVARLPLDQLAEAYEFLRKLAGRTKSGAEAGASATKATAPATAPSQQTPPPSGKVEIDESRQILDRALKEAKAGRWTEALPLFDQVQTLSPERAGQIAPYRATCFLRAGFPDLARKVVTNLPLEKLAAKEMYVLSLIMREAKIFDMAERLLVRATTREPGNRDARNLLTTVRQEAMLSADPVVQIAQQKLAPLVTQVEKIATGGMSIVCKGYHERLKRPVAIRILHPDCNDTPGLRERFFLEAVTLINLRHPNMVEAFSIHQEPKICWYTMEYLDGAVSAAEQIKQNGPFVWTEALNYLTAGCSALAGCHKKGVVHRDVNPHNLVTTSDGRIRLIGLGTADFGSKALRDCVTVHGLMRYVAPEAFLRKPLGPPSDLYSLAVTFHDLLIGLESDPCTPSDPLTFPYEFKNNLRSCGVERSLIDILRRCLDPTPSKRYPDGGVLREELARLSTESQPGSDGGEPSILVSDEQDEDPVAKKA